MTNRMIALGVLVLGLGSAAADPPAVGEFRPFASSAGRYKVMFPGAVKSETTDVKTPAATLKLTLDSVELPGGSLFIVSFIDAPDDVAKLPAPGRLDKVRDGNKGTDGKVLSEKDLEVGPDKLPGREVLIEKPNVVIRNRIVIAGNRLYQVIVQGSKDVVTAPSADKYFDSFEITK